MQRIYRAATLFRLLVRKFLALSALALWMIGASVLIGHGERLGIGLLSAILAALSAGAWRFLLLLERQHEEILTKHRMATPLPPVVKPEKSATRPAAEAAQPPGLVAQAG